MIATYNELSEGQQNNLFFVLDKAQTHQLNILKEKYGVKSGKNLIEFRNNVIHALMMEQIDLSFFERWLSQVYFEGNNTLYIYEPENNKLFNGLTFKKLEEMTKDKTQSIFNIDHDEITDITLIDAVKIEEKKQFLFTFVAPSFIVTQKIEDSITPNVRKDIYFAYIILDFELKHFVLSMHPTVNTFSVCGIKIKKDWDTIAPYFINHFRKNYITFNLDDPDWVVDALCDITEEYFYHNNPIIDKKIKEFESEILNDLTTQIISLENNLNREESKLRIAKTLKGLYENELIATYGTIPRELPFRVFLQQADKGVTTFKANSKGKPLNYADSYEIVKKMVENADISTLGITYVSNKREYPYKVSKTANYYSLKRITNAVTEKEIVDNVLRQLKQYKYSEEVEHNSGQAQETE
jgi:hypothetical protein